MSLFSRLLALMIAIGLSPLIPAGTLLIYYQKQAKDNIMSAHQVFSAASAETVSQYMGNLSQRLIFYKPLENALRQNKRYTAENILKAAMESNTDLLITAVLDTKGREVFKVGSLDVLKAVGIINLEKSSVFKSAGKSGKISVSSFKVFENKPVAELVFPLKGDRYLFLLSDFSELWKKIKKHKLAKTGRIYLADAEGRVFNFQSDINITVNPAVLKAYFKQSDAAKLPRVPSKYGYFTGAFQKVKGFNLYALTLQIRKEAFWSITLTTSFMIFLIFIICTLSYFVAWHFALKITRPIEHIVDGVERVEKQDFSKPVNKMKSFRELEHLAASFNSMMSEIKHFNDLNIDKILDEKNKTDLLIKLMRDGLVLAGGSGETLYSNDAAKAVISSKDFPAGFSGGKTGGIKPLVEKILTDKSFEDILELRIGTGVDYHYYKVNYSVYLREPKKPVVIIVFHDITLERQIDKMKEDFFNSAAHDLRAPMLGLQGYLKLLNQTKLPLKRKNEYLSSMDLSVKKIFKMIEDILDISKMESGTLALRKQKIKLTEFISSVEISVKPLLLDKNLNLVLDIDKKTDVLNMDIRLLERVLVNLISNSVKYSSNGKNITFSAKSLGKFYQFQVTDEGEGIDKENLPKIFDKFYQAAEQGQKSYGLGLAISKKIVELHNGEITASSEKGKGTTITFTIEK